MATSEALPGPPPVREKMVSNILRDPERFKKAPTATIRSMGGRFTLKKVL